MCSRLDLFQTGMTSTPCSAAFIHARNWALAWCAKRSPMPNEYFPRESMLLTGRLKPGSDPAANQSGISNVNPGPLKRRLQFLGPDRLADIIVHSCSQAFFAVARHGVGR